MDAYRFRLGPPSVSELVAFLRFFSPLGPPRVAEFLAFLQFFSPQVTRRVTTLAENVARQRVANPFRCGRAWRLARAARRQGAWVECGECG